MSDSRDPERLISEALRAHAARAPVPEPADQQDQPGQQDQPDPVADEQTIRHEIGLDSYGMLARTDWAPSAQEQPPDGPGPPAVPAEATSRMEPDAQLSAGMIILLAVLLGLAAGTAVGLLTFI